MKKVKGEERAPEPAEQAPLIDLGEFRLADGIHLVRGEGGVAVLNARNGRVREFPFATVPLMQELLGWTTMARVFRSALDGKGDVSLEDAVGLITGLVQLEALSTRREDLSGRRLGYPGAGWEVASSFIRATRTTRATEFVVPEKFAEELASKASVYRQPSAFYERVDAPFRELPNPLTIEARLALDLDDVLLQRRTSRRFAPDPLNEAQLSQLLFFAWGATAEVANQLGDLFLRKTSPSGGALHTVECYPIVLNVEGVDPGAYHYSVRRHGLEQLSTIDPHEWIVPACGDQDWIAEAGVVFLCTAFLPRMAWKYDFSRAFRAVMAETGFTSQTAFLVSAGLGLGCFTTLALRDEIFEEVLGLDPAKEPVLLATGSGTLEREVLDWSRPRAEQQAAPQVL